MKPSIKFCISILTKRENDLLNAGYESVLQEHPDRFRVIDYAQKQNNARIEMLKEGIEILRNL